MLSYKFNKYFIKLTKKSNSFFKRKRNVFLKVYFLFLGDMNDDENNSSESGESVPSEPRPSNQQQQSNISQSLRDQYNKNNQSVSPLHQFIAKPATTTEYSTTTNRQTPSFMMIRDTQKNFVSTNNNTNIRGKVLFYYLFIYCIMQCNFLY